MKFKIRHENLAVIIMLILLFILLSGAIMALIMNDIPEPYWLYGFFLQLVVFIVFIVVQTASTVVTIEGGTVKIKYVIAKKTFNISDISDIQISPYKRRHKNHYIEQRMRMTISFYDKKDIVLNDTAMAQTLGILSRREDVLPVEEVTLYQVYQVIKSQMN